jgi:hypothetical protein
MLPVTTTFSGCSFVATVCFCLAASTRFLQLPGTKRFQLPTRRRSDFLGVVDFPCGTPPIHNSIESYDSLELLLPTQPKLQSALIIPGCKQLSITPKLVSEETSLLVHFSCEMVTGAVFTINSLAFLAIGLLCFALTGVACVAHSLQPRLQ